MDEKNDDAHTGLGVKLDGLVRDVADSSVRLTRVEGEVVQLKDRETSTATNVKELQDHCVVVQRKIAVKEALTTKQKFSVAGLGASAGAIVMGLIEIIKSMLAST